MSKFENLEIGEVLSETQYYKVVKTSGDKVQLVNDHGANVVVDNLYVEQCLHSAQQFDKTEKVTKTKLAEILKDSARQAITVCFNKQVKPEDVQKELSSIYSQFNLGMTQADYDKKVKAALNLKGEERVMVGRHYGGVDVNGRISFIDMNIDRDPSKDYDTRARLVDPRTVNYIIVDNVKYQLK